MNDQIAQLKQAAETARKAAEAAEQALADAVRQSTANRISQQHLPEHWTYDVTAVSLTHQLTWTSLRVEGDELVILGGGYGPPSRVRLPLATVCALIGPDAEE